MKRRDDLSFVVHEGGRKFPRSILSVWEFSSGNIAVLLPGYDGWSYIQSVDGETLFSFCGRKVLGKIRIKARSSAHV